VVCRRGGSWKRFVNILSAIRNLGSEISQFRGFEGSEGGSEA
jgi:hypothetical protein